jgi:hypothetical protein
MKRFISMPAPMAPFACLKRSLIEKLRHYENITYVIDMVGKGAAAAWDEALAQH